MAKCPKGFECMHLIGQNKHSKFTCNTLRILPVTMTCAVLCWQTYLGTYSSAFCHIWALKKAFQKSKKCQRSPKIWVLDACINIWLARTNRQNIGWNILPARKTYAELCCQIVWEHFPQLCVKFQPWRNNWLVCLWQHHIFKMGYFKCTILFNVCTISFFSYYDIGCTMFR